MLVMSKINILFVVEEKFIFVFEELQIYVNKIVSLDVFYFFVLLMWWYVLLVYRIYCVFYVIQEVKNVFKELLEFVYVEVDWIWEQVCFLFLCIV